MPYADPNKQKEHQRQYAKTHRRRINEYYKLYRKLNKEKINAYNREFSRLDRIEIKNLVLSHYGPDGVLKCCWPGCVIDDIDMLSLDHINDDGAQHRRDGELSGAALHRVVRRDFPAGFQTLCMNHQFKKELLRKRNKQEVLVNKYEGSCND